MGLIYADRVKQLTVTTGLSDFQLDVLDGGFKTFVSGIGAGQSCYYTVENINGTEWEVGIGTVVAGTPDVITRDQVLSSSTGAKVSFSSGSKTIYCSPAAELFMRFSDGIEVVNLSTAQRNAIEDPARGLVIYNTTLDKLNIFNGVVWDVVAVTEDPPSIAVNWTAVTANGESGVVDTTELTFEFNEAPIGLTAGDIALTWATKGVMTGTGLTRTLPVSSITAGNNTTVAVSMASPEGYSITPSVRNVTVFVEVGDPELNPPIASGVFAPPTGNVSSSYFYDASVLFTGGTPTSFALATGSLPAGITFNETTGVFSGTPTTETNATGLSVTATNEDGEDTTNIGSILINAALSTVAAPVPFYGHERASATSLSTSIGFIEDPNGQEAPLSLAAFTETTVAGTRDLSGNPIDPYLHCHTEWTVTKADGSPIDEEYDGLYEHTYNPITDIVESELFNVHTDIISPELTDVILNHGDYKVAVKVYAMTDTGECLLATDEYAFTVAKPTNNHIYIDPVNGNDSNDGLDPLGLSLTNASYVESTGILTEAGAFTGLVLDGEQYDTDTADIISITGFGRARIAEVIDNDSVRIDDRWKLGSDQTGLTSSNGPKQTLVTNVANNTVYHIAAGTYDISATIDFNGKTGHCGYYSYGGKTTIKSDSLAQSSFLCHMHGVTASSNAPDKCMLSNMDFDAQGIQNSPIRGGTAATSALKHYRPIYRHVGFLRAKGNITINIGSSLNGASLAVTLWGGVIDGLRVNPGDSKAHALFSSMQSPQASFRAVGVISDADCDNSVLDHHWYPDGLYDHYHVALCYFRDGEGANYCINTNVNKNAGTWTRRFTAIHNNYFDAAYRAFDASNHNNEDVMYFSEMYIAQNQSHTINDFMYAFRLKSLFATHNYQHARTPQAFSAMFNIENAEEDWEYTLQKNKNYGTGLVRFTNGAPRLEMYDNGSISVMSSSPTYQIRNLTDNGNQYVDDNTFNSPNAPDANTYQINGSMTNLAGLNGLTNSSGNSEAAISWDDWPVIAAPSSDPSVDTSNPIAAALTGVFIANEGTGLPKNLVNDTSASIVGDEGGFSWEANDSFRVTTATSLNTNTNQAEIAVEGDYFWQIDVDIIASGSARVIYGNRNGGQESPLRFVKISGLRFEYHNQLLLNHTTGDLTGRHTISVTKNGSTLAVFIDGVKDSSSTVSIVMPINPVFIGGGAADSIVESPDIRVYHAYHGPATVSDVQAISLQNDPYQIINNYVDPEA